MIRARDIDACSSALVVLAQLVACLRTGLHPYLEDVMSVIQGILRAEGKAEIRRGAVHLLTMLIRGLGADVFDVVGVRLRDVLRDIRHVMESDSDDVTRLVGLQLYCIIVIHFTPPYSHTALRIHAGMAYKDLLDIVKSLFPHDAQ